MTPDEMVTLVTNTLREHDGEHHTLIARAVLTTLARAHLLVDQRRSGPNPAPLGRGTSPDQLTAHMAEIRAAIAATRAGTR